MCIILPFKTIISVHLSFLKNITRDLKPRRILQKCTLALAVRNLRHTFNSFRGMNDRCTRTRKCASFWKMADVPSDAPERESYKCLKAFKFDTLKPHCLASLFVFILLVLIAWHVLCIIYPAMLYSDVYVMETDKLKVYTHLSSDNLALQPPVSAV